MGNLVEYLNSVRVSSLDDIEIIVVDEGEEDNCKKIIDGSKKYSKYHKFL